VIEFGRRERFESFERALGALASGRYPPRSPLGASQRRHRDAEFASRCRIRRLIGDALQNGDCLLCMLDPSARVSASDFEKRKTGPDVADPPLVLTSRGSDAQSFWRISRLREYTA